MASEVEICNMALSMIGDSKIAARSDENDRARACDLHFDDTRDDLLRAHKWNFALKRDELVQDATPEFEWTYSYALPSDCLRVISLEEDYPGQIKYAVENNLLLCDESAVSIVYIAQITTTGSFDSMFTYCLVAKLALTLAFALTKQNTTVEAMNSLYRDRLAEARNADAKESQDKEYYNDTLTWMR